MKRLFACLAGLLVTSAAFAEDITDVDRILCAAGQAQICLETGDCYAATPYELSIPDFIIIDTKKKTVSTTEASGASRSSPFSAVTRKEGLLHLQGIEDERAFSFVIDELTGRLTAAIARDGLSVTVFGACTDADVK
ncbi:MAG: hypothetical protein QNJ00_05575 [Woeseiaceae bacterium]|nr:hypothetical protein [Woeseiaceae bacterium]